ncbi:serine/threonine-protein kinase [Dermabacter hominis]|uniref:serine/threonine-protein kinase n=1 Tax=Dermabacter hominis TaxID=36740 RepID=UPI0021A61794|nr:serine/threonine-protein kinase [Dermabacter hominis]MCT1807842.1 serine/threonine protein kinase [Dermabacter hominis]
MKTRKGLVLEGRYELTRLIATGGMGQVWEGKDQELDRPVAVKVLREEFAGEEGYLKRFRAEARHTAALAHDAIAGLYDYGELDGRAYIVMELVKGRPLSDIIEENPDGLDEDRVIAVLKELAKALDAAHVKGVVHRDVKPENVLVDDTNDWALKITDFGIARSNDQAKLTKTGLVMGTAQYLSPEQAMGKQATSLSDIYALGIVAYEMLTGSRPFTGTSQVEIAMAQVKEAPPELPERINPDLRRLVMMMLAKAPANRPRSAAVVARILDSIERGEEPRFGTSSVRASGGRSDASASASKRDGGYSSRKITSKANSRTANPISPTGTRTAAMPLAGVGSKPVTIRSSSTAASAPSARSAASANSASSASRDHRAAARRGTSTGQSVGRVSLPLLIVIAVVAIAIIVAILVATGTVSLGASTHSLEWTGADVSALLRKATVAS